MPVQKNMQYQKFFSSVLAKSIPLRVGISPSHWARLLQWDSPRYREV